jgi:serine/threonine protein kinase
VDETNTPQIIDFGLAKDEDHTKTSTSMGGGALRWTAPELFQAESKTKASDVYAVAMIIVEVIMRTVTPIRYKLNTLSKKDTFRRHSVRVRSTVGRPIYNACHIRRKAPSLDTQ